MICRLKLRYHDHLNHFKIPRLRIISETIKPADGKLSCFLLVFELALIARRNKVTREHASVMNNHLNTPHANDIFDPTAPKILVNGTLQIQKHSL